MVLRSKFLKNNLDSGSFIFNSFIQDVEMVVLMKLHWDIGSVTYPEFLPFIFDILAPNQVIFHFILKSLILYA